MGTAITNTALQRLNFGPFKGVFPLTLCWWPTSFPSQGKQATGLLESSWSTPKDLWRFGLWETPGLTCTPHPLVADSVLVSINPCSPLGDSWSPPSPDSNTWAFSNLCTKGPCGWEVFHLLLHTDTLASVSPECFSLYDFLRKYLKQLNLNSKRKMLLSAESVSGVWISPAFPAAEARGMSSKDRRTFLPSSVVWTNYWFSSHNS